MKKVAILGRTNLRPEQLEQIAGACDLVNYDRPATGRAEFVTRARDAEIILVNAFTPVDGNTVGRLPALRTIVSCSAGIDHIDIQACAAAGVNVRWFPGYCARALAEKAVTYLLMGLTRVLPAIDSVRAGGWDYFGFQSREIPGRRVVVVGLGATGRIVYDLCRAIGFEVSTIVSSTPKSEMHHLFKSADAITLHMDLNKRSRRFLDAGVLALLRKDVIIVNNARGGLVDEQALARWLMANPEATAFLDVLSAAPPDPDDPIRHLPNAVITPHIGWNSIEADAYLAKETTAAMMTAIRSGWTTSHGEEAARLLREQRANGIQH